VNLQSDNREKKVHFAAERRESPILQTSPWTWEEESWQRNVRGSVGAPLSFT